MNNDTPSTPPATGMSLESAVARLRDTADRKVDVVLGTTDNISLVPVAQDAAGKVWPVDLDEVLAATEERQKVEVGALVYGTDTPLDTAGALLVTPWAHRQIGDRIGIPWKYYDRMRQETPGLLMENVHTWWQKDPQNRMARTLAPNGTPGLVRAWVSDSFKVLDNLDFAVTVLEAAQDFGAKVHTCNVDDQRLYIQLVTPLEGEISPDDAINLGVTVRNSEVGDGRVEVSPWVYRRVCKNGLKSQRNYSRVHLGSKQDVGILSHETLNKQNDAIWSEVRDWVRFALNEENLQRILEMFHGAKQVRLEQKPRVVVANVVKRFGMGAAEANSILEQYLRQDDDSAFSLINAITRQAQEATVYQRRMDLEEMGGQLLETKPRELASALNAPVTEKEMGRIYTAKAA